MYYSHLEYPSDILEGVVSGWSLQKRFHLQTQKLQKRFHLQTQKLVEDWFGGPTPLQSDTWQMIMSDEGIRYEDGWGQHTYEKVLAHAYL